MPIELKKPRTKERTKDTWQFPRDLIAEHDPMQELADWKFDAIYDAKYQIVRRKRRVNGILEIGVRAGYSAYAMLSAKPHAQYLGLDAENGTHGGQGGPWLPHAAKILERFQNVKLRRCDTQALSHLPRGKWDIIHVDGDHSQDGTLHDLAIGWAMLPLGGWLVIDDYLHVPSVGRAVDDFVGRIAKGRIVVRAVWAIPEKRVNIVMEKPLY